MGRNFVIAGAVAIALLTGAVAGEDAGTIREFDIPTIEALGQHMYRQDQEAWKATDILLAKHSPEELRAAGARGWVVSESEDIDVVHFIREGANGPEVAYDVDFRIGRDPVLAEPKDRALPPDDLAQYDARTLAAKNFDFHCTAEAPNTVAFKDPRGKDWLVWVMSATKDPDEVVMAGHMRFVISQDGKSVIAAEKLSNSCMVRSKPRPRGDEQPVAQAFQNLVSLKPLETQVFTNLAYTVPLYVSTLDGVIWKIDGGHIVTVDLDSPAVDGATARALAGVDEDCTAIIENPGSPKPTYSIGDKLQVIGPLEHAPRPVLRAPSGKRVVEIMCARFSLVPAPNDYKVLASGVLLAIYDRGAGHAKRTISLGLEGGKISYELTDGPALTVDLKARIDKRVMQLQESYTKVK